MVTIYLSRGVVTLYSWQVILFLSLYIAISLTLYILLGLGIYTMAKNRNIKGKALAFVPFARYILLGRIAGDCFIFGMKTKKMGMLAAIFSGCYVFFRLFITFYDYYPLLTVFLSGKEIIFTFLSNGQVEVNFSYSWQGIMTALYTVFNVTVFIAEIATIVVMVSLFFEVYKKYAPDNCFLFTVLTILLDLGGIFFFIIRKRRAVNYGEYIKERFYGQRNGYTERREEPAENPFSDFKEKGEEDPFSEFPDNNDKKGGDDFFS